MEYIDLGLPSGNLWATCNIGANKSYEYGKYYDYHEILNLQSNEELVPSKEDFQELVNKCTWTWTTQSGVNGYKVIGPNGNSIFLPAAGFCNLSSVTIVGKDCYYWTSTFYKNNNDYIYYLYFRKNYYDVDWHGCGGGHVVRLIKKKNNMEKRKIEIDINTAKEWYNSNNESLKAVALQAFSEQELKSFLPKTWEEYCNNECRTGYYINESSRVGYMDQGKYGTKLNSDFDKTVFKTEEDAYAHLALMQLHALRNTYRDYYQKGWKPDWTNAEESKFCIVFYKQKVAVISQYYASQKFLSFPTRELAEQFLKNFSDLIEKAKDLI